MATQKSNHRMRRCRHIKPLATAAACLYLLVSALLVLCMAHPEDGHSHGQAGDHLDVVCVWLQKATSFHAPPAAFVPSVAEVVVFVLWSFPVAACPVRNLRLTGRSPPHIPSFA